MARTESTPIVDQLQSYQSLLDSHPTSGDGDSIHSNSSEEWHVKVDVKGQIATGKVEQGFSWSKLFKYMGPGWLMSVAYLDPGNLESDLQSGALAGYKLLWLLFWVHAAGFVIQILSARLGVVTNHHLAQLIRKTYPRRLAWVIWAFSQLAVIGSDIQEIIGTAIALKIIFDCQLWVGVLITASDTFIFMFLQQFGVRKIEVFLISLIAVMIGCFWVEMIVSKPRLGDMLEGIVVPEIPPQAVVQAVGTIGAVIMPHNLYLHSALVMSRHLGDQPSTQKIREANYYFTLESAIALLTSFVINMAIVVVFAQVFYKPDQDVTQLPGLYDASIVLSETLGPFAKYLWAAGLLAAGQSSTLTGTLAGQYVVEGFFGAIFKRDWHRIAITRMISLVPSMTVALFAIERFDTMGEILNVLQSLCLPVVLIPILKLTASDVIMTETFKSGRGFQLLAWGISWVVIGFNAYLFGMFLEYFNWSWWMVCLSGVYMLFLCYLVYIPLRTQ